MAEKIGRILHHNLYQHISIGGNNNQRQNIIIAIPVFFR